MGVHYWFGRHLCAHFGLSWLLAVSALFFSETTFSAAVPEKKEPFAPERANYGALLESGKSRAGIQWAANQAGVFVRVGTRLFFLEGLEGSHVRSTFVSNFLYGGVLSAAMVAGMHTFARMYAVAHRRMPTLLHNASHGVTLFTLALMWTHQASNAYYNGLSGGWIYVVSKLVMGVESSYNKSRPLSYNTAVPAMMFAFRLIFNGYRKRATQQMRGSLDMNLPPCLREKLFITLYDNSSNSSSTNGFEVRLSRVPISLRKARKSPVSQGCRVWNNLVKVMDRSRIDRLDLTVVTSDSGTALQASIIDYRHRYEKQISIPLGWDFDADELPWIEQRLTSGESRFGIHSSHSVLHPAYLKQLTDALLCYRVLKDKDSFRQCKKGTLYAQHEECNSYIHDTIYDVGRNYLHYLFGGTPRVVINCSKLAWLEAESDDESEQEPESWVQEGAQATFLYFDWPGPDVGYLTWRGSYAGPVIELHDGAVQFEPSSSAPVESRVRQYRVSREVSFAMNAEMNYLVRYIPHAMAYYLMIPAIEQMLPPLDGATSTAARDTLIEGQNVLRHYAPSWLSHFYEIREYMSGQ